MGRVFSQHKVLLEAGFSYDQAALILQVSQQRKAGTQLAAAGAHPFSGRTPDLATSQHKWVYMASSRLAIASSRFSNSIKQLPGLSSMHAGSNGRPCSPAGRAVGQAHSGCERRRAQRAWLYSWRILMPFSAALCMHAGPAAVDASQPSSSPPQQAAAASLPAAAPQPSDSPTTADSMNAPPAFQSLEERVAFLELELLKQSLASPLPAAAAAGSRLPRRRQQQQQASRQQLQQHRCCPQPCRCSRRRPQCSSGCSSQQVECRLHTLQAAIPCRCSSSSRRFVWG